MNNFGSNTTVFYTCKIFTFAFDPLVTNFKVIFLKSYAKIKPLLGNIKTTIIFDEVCKCHAISKKNNNTGEINH